MSSLHTQSCSSERVKLQGQDLERTTKNNHCDYIVGRSKISRTDGLNIYSRPWASASNRNGPTCLGPVEAKYLHAELRSLYLPCQATYINPALTVINHQPWNNQSCDSNYYCDTCCTIQLTISCSCYFRGAVSQRSVQPTAYLFVTDYHWRIICYDFCYCSIPVFRHMQMRGLSNRCRRRRAYNKK